MNAPYHPPRALHRLIARCAPLPRTRATLQDLTVLAGSDSWEMDAKPARCGAMGASCSAGSSMLMWHASPEGTGQRGYEGRWGR